MTHRKLYGEREFLEKWRPLTASVTLGGYKEGHPEATTASRDAEVMGNTGVSLPENNNSTPYFISTDMKA